MQYPTDGRSIVTNLVWGILMMYVCGSPAEVSGQEGASTTEEAHAGEVSGRDASTTEEAHAGVWFVPARDVEELDGLTRLIWTAQMIFVPSALAHISPLYAYDPRDLAGRTVHPDRIGDVAIVRTCPAAWSRSGEETVEQDWCAGYMSNILEAFNNSARFAYTDADDGTPVYATPRLNGGTTPPEVYFGTTYPIPGIEPEKRFVVERPR